MQTLFSQPSAPPSPSDTRERPLQKKISEERRDLNGARKDLQKRKRKVLHRYAKGNQTCELFGTKATGPNSEYAMDDLFGGPDLSKEKVQSVLESDPQIQSLRRTIWGLQREIVRLEAIRDQVRSTPDPQLSFTEAEVQSITP